MDFTESHLSSAGAKQCSRSCPWRELKCPPSQILRPFTRFSLCSRTSKSSASIDPAFETETHFSLLVVIHKPKKTRDPAPHLWPLSSQTVKSNELGELISEWAHWGRRVRSQYFQRIHTYSSTLENRVIKGGNLRFLYETKGEKNVLFYFVLFYQKWGCNYHKLEDNLLNCWINLRRVEKKIRAIDYRWSKMVSAELNRIFW